MKIGIISDTHGYLDPKVPEYFSQCDEIWHAGDVGDITVTEALEKIAPLRVVSGNIDEGPNCPKSWLPFHSFSVNRTKVLMIHIAGRPDKYAKGILSLIKKEKPAILVAGHSHILMVKFDKSNNLLFINPGAAGNHGFHTVKTLLRFEIQPNGTPTNLEVIELGKRGALH